MAPSLMKECRKSPPQRSPAGQGIRYMSRCQKSRYTGAHLTGAVPRGGAGDQGCSAEEAAFVNGRCTDDLNAVGQHGEGVSAEGLSDRFKELLACLGHPAAQDDARRVEDAAEHGDARRALDLLRVAGEIAERNGAKLVTEEHVRAAERRIEHDRILEALQNLPLHSKLVLYSVYLLGKANVNDAITGDIYEVYHELCSEAALVALTQRRVSGLINELDAIGLLNSRLVNRGRYGRTKKIRLSVASSLIYEAFMNDQRLGRLINYETRYLSQYAHSRR
ncbi:MAG: hypothetical protein K6V36_04360 [Anaerolineae bacterium]|nr:hypothetical protein [Anaerolineae bacterium]